MSKTTTITKETLQSFRTDFANAMKKLEKQYGIQISIGNIKYGATNFSTRLEAKTLDTKTGKVAVNMQYELFAKMALIDNRSSNFSKEVVEKRGVLGQSFITVKGEVCQVTDYNSRKPKFCFAILLNGKTYNCPAGYLKSYAN